MQHSQRAYFLISYQLFEVNKKKTQGPNLLQIIIIFRCCESVVRGLFFLEMKMKTKIKNYIYDKESWLIYGPRCAYKIKGVCTFSSQQKENWKKKKKKTKVCEACGMLFWFGKSSIYDWNFPIKF